MHPARKVLWLSAALLIATGCNPNFGMGGASETPPDWKSPNGVDTSASSDGGVPSMDELIKKLKAKVAADTKDVESRKQLGLLLAEEQQYDDAAKVLEEAEAIAPNDVEVRVARAKVLIRRKDQGAAKMELDAAAKLKADDEMVLREWGEYYVMADDLAAAVKARKKLLDKHPDIADAESIQREMFYLEHLPRLRESKKLKDFFDLVGAGADLQGKGNHEEAIAKFKAATEVLPEDPNLWADLGVSQHKLGKNADAIVSLKKSLSLDKDGSKARIELAQTLADTGDKKGAEMTLKEWTKIDARRAKQRDVEGMLVRLAKGEPLQPAAGASPAVATSPTGGSVGGSAGGAQRPGTPGVIHGTVDIAPSLVSQIPAGAKFYLFAKTSQGGGPPLAVMRVETVPSFPWSFELTKNNVMMQGMEFAGNVWITARVDADGTAGPGPGDLEGATADAVAVGTDGVHLTIDKVRGADGKLTPAAGGGSAPVAMQTADAPAPAGGGDTVSGTIDLDPAVRAKVPSSAMLFVFAKANQGGGPPMAVYRQPIDGSTKFPLPFSLSQANVMMPGMQFAGSVYVTARIDVDGVAGAGPGDLEGMTKSPIAVGTKDVKVVIDTVR